MSIIKPGFYILTDEDRKFAILVPQQSDEACHYIPHVMNDEDQPYEISRAEAEAIISSGMVEKYISLEQLEGGAEESKTEEGAEETIHRQRSLKARFN